MNNFYKKEMMNQSIISKRLSEDQKLIINAESENYAKEGQLTKIQDNKVKIIDLGNQINGLIETIKVLIKNEITLKKDQEEEEVSSPEYFSLHERMNKNQNQMDSMQYLINKKQEELINLELINIRLEQSN